MEQKFQKIMSKTGEPEYLPDFRALRKRATIVLFSSSEYEHCLRVAQQRLCKTAEDAVAKLRDQQALLKEDLIDISEIVQRFQAGMRFSMQDVMKTRFLSAIEEEYKVVCAKIQEMQSEVQMEKTKPYDHEKYLAEQTRRIDELGKKIQRTYGMTSTESYFKKVPYLQVLAQNGIEFLPESDVSAQLEKMNTFLAKQEVDNEKYTQPNDQT